MAYIGTIESASVEQSIAMTVAAGAKSGSAASRDGNRDTDRSADSRAVAQRSTGDRHDCRDGWRDDTGVFRELEPIESGSRKGADEDEAVPGERAADRSRLGR